MILFPESAEMQHARTVVLHANTPGYISRHLRPLAIVQRLAHDASPSDLLREFNKIRENTVDRGDAIIKLYLILAALWVQQTPDAINALRRCGPHDLHWIGAVKDYMLARAVPSSFTRNYLRTKSVPAIAATRLPLSRMGGAHA